MGLDMYLKSTGHNHRRVRELARSRAKEFCDYLHLLIKEPKYAGLHGVNRLTLTDKIKDKEKRDLLASFKKDLRAKARALEGIVGVNLNYLYVVPYGEDDPVEEIGYWRKEWNLHKFIIENFGDPNNDNLTEVYLDEAAISKIIDHYKDDTEYSDAFRQALYIVKGGGVVYYWAWY